MIPAQTDRLGRPQSARRCKYEYRPLKEGEIRVIDLDPGGQDSALRCSIRHVSLGSVETIKRHIDDIYSQAHDEATESHPRYEAISYTWGSPDLQATALVDSRWSLAITKSLAEALRYLRHAEIPRTLWADAICINQEDLAEKSYQVSIMALIYKLADKVLVWLGVGEGFDTFVFTWIERSRIHKTHHCPASANAKDCPLRMPPLACMCCDSVRASHGSEPQQVARGMMSLLTRPWWTRLWVLQEAFDRRRIVLHSGTHHTTWSDLAAASETTLSHFGLLVQTAFERFCAEQLSTGLSDERHLPFGRTTLGNGKLAHLRESPKWTDANDEGSWRVVECLLDSLDRQCTQLLDRIYAIRFIAGLQHVPALQPDYQLSPQAVYGAFTRQLLTSGSANTAAMVLSLASVDVEDPQFESRNWPSWVPKLHVLAGMSHDTRRDVSREQDITFGRVFVRPTSDAAELSLSGWIIGSVLAVLPQAKSSFRHPSRYDAIAEFLKGHDTSFGPAQNSHSNRGRFTLKLESSLQFFGHDHEMSTNERHELARTIEDAFESSWTIGVLQLHGLSFATWIPYRSRPGDLVCLFCGVQSLFVLREEGSLDRFSLIGDCPVSSKTVHEVAQLDPEISKISPGGQRIRPELGEAITLV